MGRLARIAATLKQKYKEEKAHLKGEGMSKARMVKNAKDIPEIQAALNKGPAQPIQGANITMLDKQPMTFFTDGSLRNSFGSKPEMSGRQRTKLRKKIRRARKGQKKLTIRRVEE